MRPKTQKHLLLTSLLNEGILRIFRLLSQLLTWPNGLTEWTYVPVVNIPFYTMIGGSFFRFDKLIITFFFSTSNFTETYCSLIPPIPSSSLLWVNIYYQELITMLSFGSIFIRGGAKNKSSQYIIANHDFQYKSTKTVSLVSHTHFGKYI